MYLPQYHEFEENNRWWGKGFTEWTCVNRARSLSPNHRIKKPHSDIGYYSLLDCDFRRRQSEMAKSYGVYGFCYYHYWFGDKVLMDKTLKLMLEDGQPDIPFCLSWANEPWTRRMNGGDGELLQPNNYGDDKEWDDHLNYLLPFFKNKNYIKIDNKPIFIIYRLGHVPNAEKRFSYYNDKLKSNGFNGLFLVYTVGNFLSDNFARFNQFTDASFDSYPNFLWDKNMIDNIIGNTAFYDIKKAYNRITQDLPFHPKIHFKGMMVGFDSSPRSPKQSNVFVGGSPKLFEECLSKLFCISKSEYIFVNAWNEWGEGCALEPEEQDGYEYLKSLKRVVGIHNIKF